MNKKKTYKPLKVPKTIDEQLQILKDRCLIINDYNKAKDILSATNYYNFTGYLFDFMNSDGQYENTTFEKAYNTYLCDKRLKSIILYSIELIEHNIKSNFAYVIAHNLGPLGYKNPDNFIDDDTLNKTIGFFNDNINRNKDIPFVKHHLNTYGDFPVWVAFELFTLGNLYKLYRNFKKPIKKLLSAKFDTGIVYLESWLNCLVYLRNLCAHSMRLYNLNIPFTPKKSKNDSQYIITHRIFDIVYIMKFLVPNNGEWENYIIPSIQHIFEEYNRYIDIYCYGFPENWESMLLK